MGNIERDRYGIAADHEGSIDHFTDWIDDVYASLCITDEKNMGRFIITLTFVFLYLYDFKE